MKYLLSLLSTVSAYSRNQSVSEYGIAFTYNTHLLDWDIDVPDSGTAVLNGYFYVQGTNKVMNPGYNETEGEEPIYEHPKWTNENSLRICMSFFSDQSLVREYIRWSLEYRPPKFFASFWPQMLPLGADAHEEHVNSFCALSGDDVEGIPPEDQIQDLDDDDDADVDEGADAAAEDGGRRMLLTDEEALAEEQRLEAYEAGMNAGSAPLPVDFNGYSTTLMAVDIPNQIANVSFQRPFVLESDYNMQINVTQTYKVFLNWGVFENTTDTNTTYIFGASKQSDAQVIILLDPTYAQRVVAGITMAVSLICLFY